MRLRKPTNLTSEEFSHLSPANSVPFRTRASGAMSTQQQSKDFSLYHARSGFPSLIPVVGYDKTATGTINTREDQMR
jgi:hypothetical protein